MTEAAPEEFQSAILEELLDPKNVESLHGIWTSGEIALQVFERPGAPPRAVTLRNMYPFMTLMDIKLALYAAMDFNDKAIPEYVFLGKPVPPAGKRVLPVDYNWSVPSDPTKPVGVFPPLELAAGRAPADTRFVESNGERRILGFTGLERMTIEDVFFKGATPRLPQLQAYFYSDLEALVPGGTPISEADWNGRLYPYFPRLSVSNNRPTAQVRERARRFARGFVRRRQFFQRLEEILEAAEPVFPLSLTGIKFLRIAFAKPKGIAGIEALFYEIPVNSRRPYMRLMPAEGTPVSKVHMIGDKPNLEDPRLLVQWSQERSPTPERDFALAKILLRKGAGNLTPLYITLRLTDDGTADFTVEPPKGIRKLEPNSDLDVLPQVIKESLQGLPYLKETPRLTNGMFIFGLHLKGAATTPFTQTTLRAKLPLFSGIFQEIPPLPNERPLLMLRYKLISNFVTEDRIQSFITQVLSRKVVKGDAGLADLVELVAEDFDLDLGEARKRVAEKLKSGGDMILVNPDTKDYALNEHTGIDIAIFAQHPFYAFHVYRVDSAETLRRIVTFLSMLFSKTAAELEVKEEAVREVLIAEAEESKSREEEAAAATGFENVEGEGEGAATGFENVEEGEGAPATGFENVDNNAAQEGEATGFENVDEANLKGAVAAAQEQTAAPPEGAEGFDERPDYYDDLMFDIGEGTTLEQAEAAKNAAAAVAVEGAAEPDGAAAAAAEEDAALFPEDKKASPSDQLRAALGEEREHAKEDAEEAAVVQAPARFAFKKKAAAAAPAAPAAPAEPAPQEEEEPAGRRAGFETYFSDKLKEADRRLFDFHKTHPSLKKYVSQCGSNLGRQPAVLSQQKYEQMLEEYKDLLESKPPKIHFYVFPLAKDKTVDPYSTAGKEYYTLMKYGTSERNQHYYLCCRYFCVRDEILVREVELQGTRLRRPVKQADGTMRTTKAPGTCPFCEGKVIKDRRFPGVNETVLERISKPGTADKRHLFIRFLKKTNHPEGYWLPCCFLDDDPVRIGHPAYPEPAPEVYAGQKAALAFAEEEEDEGEAAAAAAAEVIDEATLGDVDQVSYEELLTKTRYAYIVGAEKLPLEGAVKKIQKTKGDEGAKGAPKLALPQIGILPAPLNTYFSQDPTELVSRTMNPQKLKPNAQGFLRVGVENRSRYMKDSFLAAVAPFFGKSSARAMKLFLADIIQPRIFLGLNYGNLALEMYRAGLARPKVDERLKAWAKTHLRIRKVTTANEELVVRAFMSYSRFQTWLDSDEETKEYRHFAHLFMQPGILQTGVRRTVAETGAVITEARRPGVIFIVLDMLKSGEIKVRCPPYPINKDLYTKSDIGFLFHHYSGIWEPIFYVDNRNTEEKELNAYYMLFSNSQYARWPKIVQDRVREFSSQCASRLGGRGIYTGVSGVASNRIIGGTMLRQQFATDDSLQFYGHIRDAYNHLGALIYKTETSGLVAIPVIDDGLGVADGANGTLVMDWDDYDAAPIDQVVAFYEKYVQPRYPKLYAIVRAVISEGTGQVEAVQLANGLYVPVAPTDPATVPPLTEEPGVVSEMEWKINREIAEGGDEGGEIPGEETRLRMKEFNEVYEHLRLTFSNWLASLEDGGSFRTALEFTITRRDLPLFEKRKRMEIMLASEIESWLAESDEDAPRQASLLRVDCRLRPEAECTGMCEWRAAEAEAKGRCLLHVPATSPIEGVTASGARVLLLRLIEELLRYGGKRKQIFEQRVSQLALLENPVRDKDQYILPEKSAKWAELLRLQWAQTESEKPRYIEEMSRLPTDEEVAAAAPRQAELSELSALSPSLITLLGTDDPKIAPLRLYPSPGANFIPFLSEHLSVSGAPFGITEDTTELTDTMIIALVRKSMYPIVQIDLRPATPKVIAYQLARDLEKGYPVFVLRDDLPPSMLVVDPEDAKPLQKSELPEVLKAIISSSKKQFVKTAA